MNIKSLGTERDEANKVKNLLTLFSDFTILEMSQTEKLF